MKKSYRVLTIFLCLVMFFVAGCTGGPSFGEGVNDPLNLDGVKVLRKPSDYSISDAVGTNSEYYYNLFAGNIMQSLYNVYSNLSGEDGLYENTLLKNENSGICNEKGEEISETDVYTYKNNYLYDSIRSSITQIENTYDSEDNLTSGKVVLDLTGWKFNFKNYDSMKYQLGILNTDTDSLGIDFEFRTFSINENIMSIYYQGLEDDPLSGYLDYIQETFGTPGDYHDYYYGSQIDKEGNVIEGASGTDEKIYYRSSPYYQQYVAELAKVTALNDYQDALEYAIYLFVLGYDYVDDNGNPVEEDLPYFDFQITHTAETIVVNEEEISVLVPHVSVGGWSEDYISIQEALAFVKDSYLKMGNYIGLTDKNKAQIERFILDYVIGVEKDDEGNYDSTFQFTVTDITKNDSASGSTETRDVKTYVIDREYKQVVENIINYACEQVLIGDGVDGNTPVKIDSAYPISQIVDYDGDYFSISVMDEDGNYDDGDVMAHIEEAEYQSMVLKMPEDGEPFPYNLTDIILIFQYYDTGTTNRELVYDDEITINVGINYYDSQNNLLTQSEPVQRTIKYGLAMEGIDFSAGVDPDKNWLQFTTDETVAGGYGSEKMQYMEPIPVKMSFDANIDNGILNADINGIPINEHESVINITGSSPAREYYKLNNSSSYGQYATFNPDKFAGKTDYIEIYFDVVREKGNVNKNYNFKVGTVWIWPEDK